MHWCSETALLPLLCLTKPPNHTAVFHLRWVQFCRIFKSNTHNIIQTTFCPACYMGLTPSTLWYGPSESSRSNRTPLRAQVKVRSMVGSWDAWHCSVTFSPWLMSALEGASVILVASAKFGQKREPVAEPWIVLTLWEPKCLVHEKEDEEGQYLTCNRCFVNAVC